MRPTGSAAARLAGHPAKRTGSAVLSARRTTPPSPNPRPGSENPTPDPDGGKGGRSPMLFAALVFGLPLLLVILWEIMRS